MMNPAEAAFEGAYVQGPTAPKSHLEVLREAQKKSWRGVPLFESSGSTSPRLLTTHRISETPSTSAKASTSKAKEVAGKATEKAKGAASKVSNSLHNKAVIAKEYSKYLADELANKAGKATLNLGRNALTGLSVLGPVATLGGLGYEGLKAAGEYAGDAQRGYEDAGIADELPVVYGEDGTITDPETGLSWTLPGRGSEAVAAMAPSAPVSEEGDTLYQPSDAEGASYEYHPEPAPMEPLPEPAPAPVITKNALEGLNGLSDAELATAVIRGKYGNGAARKAALGDRYAAVQALVNQRMRGSTPSAPKASSTPATIVPLPNGMYYNTGTGHLMEVEDMHGLRGQIF